MLRALYGQFKRFLGWLNGPGPSVKDVRTTAGTSRVATAAAGTATARVARALVAPTR